MKLTVNKDSGPGNLLRLEWLIFVDFLSQNSLFFGSCFCEINLNNHVLDRSDNSAVVCSLNHNSINFVA